MRESGRFAPLPRKLVKQEGCGAKVNDEVQCLMLGQVYKCECDMKIMNLLQ